MSEEYIDEGNLRFDFSACGKADRFDATNPHGMKAVDFIVDAPDCLYFIEVKDYQNPDAPEDRRREDYNMLISADKEKNAAFCVKMGMKIKDSLLRHYASGETFAKKVVYLLLINLDNLGENERGRLKEKISGHVPSGLNHSRFGAFTEISFKLVNAEQLKTYGICCSTK